MIVTGGCAHLGARRVRPSKGDLSSKKIRKPGPLNPPPASTFVSPHSDAVVAVFWGVKNR